ncbi:MAG TPA: DOMON-like domain-containing protein [Candidatus Binatia bacterium]|nr:DOMON-like domain-containing protein [Candidatus Binatia bacterium]
MTEANADAIARSGRPLVPHPTALPRSAVELRAAVTVHRDRLAFWFELRGDVAALAVARESRSPGRVDRLWRHTCFEAFVAAEEGARYLELNVAPSRDWALFAFDDYRSGMRAAPVIHVPDLSVHRDPDILRVEAVLALSDVRGGLGAPPALAGLAAVIEETGGRLSYWASRHPGERPDFHRRDGWTVAVYGVPGA